MATTKKKAAFVALYDFCKSEGFKKLPLGYQNRLIDALHVLWVDDSVIEQERQKEQTKTVRRK